MKSKSIYVSFFGYVKTLFGGKICTGLFLDRIFFSCYNFGEYILYGKEEEDNYG